MKSLLRLLIISGALIGLSPATADQPGSATEDSAKQQDLLTNDAVRAWQEGQSVSPQQIARWIDQLGADSYARRMRSRQKLTRVGLAAFDQLRQATDHGDNEIAVTARQLTQSLQVRWYQPDETEAVRQLLDQYGALLPAQRRDSIEGLADLPVGQSLAALVRIARYESDASLARRAAIAVLRSDRDASPGVADAPDRVEPAWIGRTIRDGLPPQETLPTRWLNLYAEEQLAGTAYPERWNRLLSETRAEVKSLGDALSRDLLAVLQTAAERTRSRRSPGAAASLVADQLALLPPQTLPVKKFAMWALDQSLPSVVGRLKQQHGELFNRSAFLLYAAAKSAQLDEQPEQARRLIAQARDLEPLESYQAPDDPLEQTPDGSRPELKVITQHRIRLHLRTADDLRDQGWFDWALAELRHVGRATPPGSIFDAQVRLQQANIHADLLQHDRVVDVLGPLAERVARDDELQREMSQRRFAYGTVASLVQYHRGLAAKKAGKLDAARPALRQAYAADRENIDILIAMYHTPGDAQWQEQVKEQLSAEIARVQRLISDESGRGERSRVQYLNHYAWLVSNTEGDTRQALRYSQRSLELMPDDSALLDTCARCHFAVGNLAQAVQLQQRAVRIKPHSPPLQRQLTELQAALAAADDAGK